MYLFIYLCVNVSIYLFFIYIENLKCDRRSLVYQGTKEV